MSATIPSRGPRSVFVNPYSMQKGASSRKGRTISFHPRMQPVKGEHDEGYYSPSLVMENFRKFSQVEIFPTMFAHRFLLAYFYRNIYVKEYFYRIIYAFKILSMFWETFGKFSSLPVVRHACHGLPVSCSNQPSAAGALPAERPQVTYNHRVVISNL
jgi:hypothetical protein